MVGQATVFCDGQKIRRQRREVSGLNPWGPYMLKLGSGRVRGRLEGRWAGGPVSG